VISNQVGAMWGFVAGLIPHIRGGTLKALAIGSKERSRVLPEVPTVAEAGVPSYEAVSWIGLLGPAALPRPIVEKLNDACHKAMQVVAVQEALARDGSESVASKPEEFRQVIESDYAKYGNLRDILKGAQ
jgi:tripartite-type tricarboxylate transporter receptor subunit TctC